MIWLIFLRFFFCFIWNICSLSSSATIFICFLVHILVFFTFQYNFKIIVIWNYNNFFVRLLYLKFLFFIKSGSNGRRLMNLWERNNPNDQKIWNYSNFLNLKKKLSLSISHHFMILSINFDDFNRFFSKIENFWKTDKLWKKLL